MTMNFLAFDIEVCKWWEDGADWRDVKPLGISCIGLMGTGWEEPDVYYAGMLSDSRDPEPRPMNSKELKMFTDNLRATIGEHGQTLVSLNGTSFDFAVLADETKEEKYFARLAMNSIDHMFYVFCKKGWFVGLNQLSTGLGLPGKLQGISGKDAPKLWMEGTDEERLKILQYVAQDAKATLGLVTVASFCEKLEWVSTKGKIHQIRFQYLPTVQECLSIPLPDTSWMTRKPATREDLYSWISPYLEKQEYKYEYK